MNNEIYYSGTPQGQDNSVRLFRFVLLGVIVLLMLIGVYYLFSYVSEGSIFVKTAANNSVTALITNELSSTSSKPIKIKANEPQKVKPGTYIVTVSYGLYVTKQVVKVKSFSTTTTNISLNNKQMPIEPVASVAANQLSVSSNTLNFIDASNNNLETITNNQLSSVNSNYSFQTVVWSNTNYGIAKTFNGSLYTVSNGNIQPLSLPGYISDSNFNYTVSPDQTAYFVNKSGVYSYTTTNGFKLIYKEGHYPASISAGTQYVSVSWPSGSNNNAIVMSKDGSLIYKGATPATGFTWSTNGNLVAVFGESYGGVFNKSMQQLALIPNTNFVDPTWINENTLVYASGNKVWSYNYKKQRSTIIATSDYNLQNITLSSRGSYIYLTGQPRTLASSSIYRIGLKNQTVSQTAMQLGQHLPVVLGFCRLGYINFTSTQLLIQSFINPLPSTCSNTPNYLSQYGINNLSVENSSVLANKY